MMQHTEDNFIAEKDQQIVCEKLIIAEKSEKIGQHGEELADAEVKLNQNAFLVTENKQEMKMELKLEPQIKPAEELNTEQINDKSTQTGDFKFFMLVKNELRDAKFESGQTFEDLVETAMNEHKLDVNNDAESYKLRVRVDILEQYVDFLKNQLKLADNDQFIEQRRQKQFFLNERVSTDDTAMETQTVDETLEDTSKSIHSGSE